MDAAAAGDQGTSPPPRIKIRIESLSDLVFGLALSIGSIILVGSVPQDGVALATNVLYFGFGFAIIVLTWLGYSRTTAVLPDEVPFALFSNIFLLFVVALEPYLFYVLINAQSAGLADAASVAYGLDVGGMFLMQAALASLVLKEQSDRTVPAADQSARRPLHPVTLARFRVVARSNFLVGLVFVASALPIFWIDTPIGYLRFYLWSSSFVLLYPLFRYRGRRTRTYRVEKTEDPKVQP